MQSPSLPPLDGCGRQFTPIIHQEYSPDSRFDPHSAAHDPNHRRRVQVVQVAGRGRDALMPELAGDQPRAAHDGDPGAVSQADRGRGVAHGHERRGLVVGEHLGREAALGLAAAGRRGLHGSSLRNLLTPAPAWSGGASTFDGDQGRGSKTGLWRYARPLTWPRSTSRYC